MTCPVCHFPLIPGVTDCVNCGEPVADPASAEDVARWMAENGEARAFTQAMTTGRALEAAGDPDGAIAIYERLIDAGCCWPQPYRRAAIVYRKAKDGAAEERVVRAALGHLGEGVNGWFILRLAKLLAQQPQRLRL